MKRTLACFVLVLGVSVPLVFAAPRLKIDPPAKKISTGQSVVMRIRLEWPQAEGPYEVNSLEPKLENLTLEDQRQSQESGETVSQTFLYEFRPVKAGTAVIYPFEISYRKEEKEPWVPVLVPQQTIKVSSSLPFKIALIGLAVIAGLSAAVLSGIKLGQLLKARAVAKSIPPPDPKQRVYAKAEESIATFSSSDPKEKLIHWSNQLRTVVSTYYDASSGASTNAGLLSFLKTKGLPMGEWNEISRIFEQLTEMQFSRQDIPAYDLDRMQKALLQYVKGKIIIGNSNA